MDCTSSLGISAICREYERDSPVEKSSELNVTPKILFPPKACAARVIHPLPPVISLVNQEMYHMERNIPLNPANIPLSINAMALILFTDSPTEIAASGFSPTAFK